MQALSNLLEVGDAPSGDGSTLPVSQGVTRPGEFIHYYTNLLSLFGEDRPANDIRAIARAASVSRERAIHGFDTRLQGLNDDFTRQRSTTGMQPVQMPLPSMRGWDVEALNAIVSAHGSALIALFHFGEHRQVFADLACLGVPYVAPVAKHAYFDCCEMLKRGPEPFREAMSLIEVEDPRVGRKLVSALRRSRIGLIYVDGNMGPDGHLVEEGAVRVDFLGKRIRVKAGIARLSAGLGLPIVPLFASSRDGVTTVRLNPLILPPARPVTTAGSPSDAVVESIMQTLYVQLGEEVRRTPEQWEFAFCFHRWIDESESADPRANVEQCLTNGPLGIDRQRIAEYRREGELFWIHIGRQRAYRLPDWANGLYARLDGGRVGLGESLAHLQQAGGSADQVEELVAGLIRLGLLQQAPTAA